MNADVGGSTQRRVRTAPTLATTSRNTAQQKKRSKRLGNERAAINRSFRQKKTPSEGAECELFDSRAARFR
jgi:hypothetical protein